MSTEQAFRPDDTDLLAEARTIDEARLQMVVELHRAMYGDSWARPEPPAVVWRELLDRVAAARRAFQR